MVTPPHRRGEIIGAYKATKSVAETARILGEPPSTVRDVVNNNLKKGDAETPTKAPKKSLDDRGIRRLRRTFKNNPFQTYTDTAPEFNIHRTTLSRYLHQIGMNSRVMRSTVFMDQPKIDARLEWARVNADRDWKTVIFTDESIFQTKAKNVMRVVRPAGKDAAYDRKYSRPRFRSGWSSVHVWGALAYGKRYPLMRVDTAVRAAYPDAAEDGISKLSAERYANLVLFERLSTYAAELAREGRQGLVVEDGASIHTARVCERARDELGLVQVEHPASSPDLNPIEHLWALIKQRIWKRVRRPRTKEELWVAIQEEYAAIPQSVLDALVLGMDVRPAEVIKAKGWHTGH